MGCRRCGSISKGAWVPGERGCRQGSRAERGDCGRVSECTRIEHEQDCTSFDEGALVAAAAGPEPPEADAGCPGSSSKIDLEDLELAWGRPSKVE